MQGVDDMEPFHVKGAQPSDPSIEKHYALVITLAGHGVLDYGVLRSGSKCIKQPDDIVYWFDKLVELGIGTAEEEAMLRATVWEV